MSRLDKCTICDYSEAHGSSPANLAPGKAGKVRKYGDDFLCDKCFVSVEQNYSDLCRQEDDT